MEISTENNFIDNNSETFGAVIEMGFLLSCDINHERVTTHFTFYCPINGMALFIKKEKIIVSRTASKSSTCTS